MSSAWLKPRLRSFFGARGRGTRTISANNPVESLRSHGAGEFVSNKRIDEFTNVFWM